MTGGRRRYNDNREWFGRYPPAVPPLDFQHVTVRVFPLRANMSVLRRFCESVFNIAPRSVGCFHPFLPYVYLAFLDYGKMAVEEVNLGWVAQHEVVLTVPLEWHRQRRGRSELAGRVWANPFIFVDDPSSLTSGREVYGWPKVLVSLEPALDPWISDPSAPHPLLRLSAREGRRERPLLEIEHHLAQSASLAPPDLRVLDPLANVSRLFRTSWSLAQNLLESFTALPLFGYRNHPGALPRILTGGLEAAGELLRDPGYHILTLKQFRDAELPEHACYQALVDSRIGINRYNRGGTLGNFNLLQGDLTGGFRIRIHRHLAHPLVEALGLEVAGRVELEGRSVDVLEPVLPFWMDVDLSYSLGRVLCWRTRKSPWYVGRTRVPGTGPDPVTRPHGHVYSTFTSGAAQARPGPLYYSETVYYVLPLLADKRERLGKFVADYFPVDGQHCLELFGDYVYLVASGGDVTSEAASFAWLGGAEVDFYVPVLCFEKVGGRRELLSVGLVPAFAFLDDVSLAITAREVTGESAVEADVESPPESWLSGADRRLLRVRTDVFAVLGEGVRSERRVLLEIVQTDPPNPDRKPKGDSGIPWSYIQRVASGKTPLNIFTLKQFRDAARPHFACYQALILTECWLRGARGQRRLDPAIHVRLHRYPSHPISDVLGLKVERREPSEDVSQEAAMIEHLHPKGAFWFRAGLRTSSKELARQAGELDWSWLDPSFSLPADVLESFTGKTG